MVISLIFVALRMPPWAGRAWWSDRLCRLHRMAGDARARACSRREFAGLDRAALRDLGVDRSEYESYRLEAEGALEATRLRIARLALRDARAADR